MGTRKEKGREGPGDAPCLVPGEKEEGPHAYLQSLPWEARASEQSEAAFPATVAAAPPPPRTNTSALPKGVSHHRPSEGGQALSLAHSHN